MKKCIALLLILLLTTVCASAESVPMRTTAISWDGDTVGKCFAPSDFRVEYGVDICTDVQSLNNPLLLQINAVSPDEGIVMRYVSAQDYIHLLAYTMGNTPIATHVDGQIDSTTLTPMLQFMYPSAYCDYIATQAISGIELTIDAEDVYPAARARLQQAAQRLYDESLSMGAQVGIQVEGTVVDACARRYTFAFKDTPYYMVVATGIQAIQTLAQLPGVYGTITNNSITWGAPYAYIFLCPQAQYDLYAPCFELFMDNTAASDQFVRANTRLSTEIRESVIAARSLYGAASYSRGVLSDETGREDDSYEDRFTDYLFDDNDYTLSDGSSVKVSTAYDYVYEDEYGNVIVTDSAGFEPAGCTRLTANR